MSHLKELGDIYLNLLCEDQATFFNQAKTILKNNGVQEHMMDSLMGIFEGVRFTDPNNRVANIDSNIPALAYWYIADSDLEKIRVGYNRYVNTPELYSTNYLGNKVEEIKREISSKKLFKQDKIAEKLALITDTFREVVEEIDNKYKKRVQQLTDKDFRPGQKDENVVYEDDDILVYKADEKAKCIKYGKNSNLCISGRGGGNYYWKYRMGGYRRDGLGMTTYFVVFKNEYYPDGRHKIILIDSMGDANGPAGQYSWNPIFDDRGKHENKDQDITPYQLYEKHPELKNALSQGVFQFLPWTDKEKKFHKFDGKKLADWDSSFNEIYIDRNIEDLADMEMAIEAGGVIPNYGQIWDAIDKRFPGQINELFKKYALVNAPDDDNSRMLPWKLLSKYLSPSDIKKYFEEADEYDLNQYAIRQLYRNQDSDFLLDIVFNDPNNIRNFMYDLKDEHFPSVDAVGISDKIVEKMVEATALRNYLDIFQFPSESEGRSLDDFVRLTPDSYFDALLKNPRIAADVIGQVFRYDIRNAKEFDETEDDAPKDRVDQVYQYLVDMVSNDDDASVTYARDYYVSHGVPKKIWNTVISNPTNFKKVLDWYYGSERQAKFTDRDIAAIKGDPSLLAMSTRRPKEESFNRLFNSVQRLI